MFFNFNISQIRDFINKERVYMLMLSFILLFNAFIIFAEKIPTFAQGSFLGQKMPGSRLAGKKTEVGYSLKADEEIAWAEVLERKRHIPILVSMLGFVAVSVFSLGLFLDIRILMAKVKKREILKASGPHLGIKWGIWDIFRLAIIFVFLGYILHIFEAHFLLTVSGEKSRLAFISLLNTGIMDLAILGFIIYFVKVKYSQGLSVIGLKIKDTVKNIFLAVLSYIAFLPILGFLLFLLIWLATLFNYQPPRQALFKLFFHEERIWILGYSTMVVVLLGPIVEEVFFRGFTYNAIKRRWGVPKAAVLTAAVFAGLHASLIGFLPIMALGLLLAYVYEKTGSLIPSITIHILHNALMVALLFLGRYFMYLVD